MPGSNADESLGGQARKVFEVESEEQALKELKAMPIYFASSYAMVKPYVSDFDTNILDAPSLKRARVDTGWVEKKPSP